MTTRFRRHVLAESRSQSARTARPAWSALAAAACALALASFATGATPSSVHRAAALSYVRARADVLDPDARLLHAAKVNEFGGVWRLPADHKVIALTFDDGPYPFYTPLLLHVLERSQIHATFFVVGRNAQEFPELVSRIVHSGDEIGNHTFNHYKLTFLNDAQITHQIRSCGSELRQFTGRPITLFRPPHGRYDRRVMSIARTLGYRTIFWSDSPEDTKDISPALLVQRVLHQAQPGAIVLMHSGQYKTVVALPVIIAKLRERGYTFATVGELLADPDPN